MMTINLEGQVRAIFLELLHDPSSNLVPPHISQNKWDSIVTECKLDDKFINEYPLSTSPFLNQILSDLTSMVINLNNAKDRIRKASNTSDYNAVMGDVKSSLD
ncbi:MAG: hypothetical protein ACJ72J_00870 [Nitrososphaeraceae archaeon]